MKKSSKHKKQFFINKAKKQLRNRIRSKAKRKAKRIRLNGLSREALKVLNQRKRDQEILIRKRTKNQP